MSQDIPAMLAGFKDVIAELCKDRQVQSIPRRTRKRPRKPEERGLPGRDALVRLAWCWLEKQRELWPELKDTVLLPEPSEAVCTALADDFRSRFLDGKVKPFENPLSRTLWNDLAGAYERFSSDKSNNASLDQQLLKQLTAARAERLFIPWQYVFADAAVTGDASAPRQEGRQF